MRSQEIGIAFALVISVFLVVVAIPQGDPRLTTFAVGLLLFNAGWGGMYRQLRREAPEHPLVRAAYVGLGRRFTRASNLFQLVGAHWSRHGLDPWSALFAAGLGMLALSLVLTMGQP